MERKKGVLSTLELVFRVWFGNEVGRQNCLFLSFSPVFFAIFVSSLRCSNPPQIRRIPGAELLYCSPPVIPGRYRIRLPMSVYKCNSLRSKNIIESNVQGNVRSIIEDCELRLSRQDERRSYCGSRRQYVNTAGNLPCVCAAEHAGKNRENWFHNHGFDAFAGVFDSNMWHWQDTC